MLPFQFCAPTLPFKKLMSKFFLKKKNSLMNSYFLGKSLVWEGVTKSNNLALGYIVICKLMHCKFGLVSAYVIVDFHDDTDIIANFL